MMEIKYNIGDKVWYASYANRETTVLCDDCYGTGLLHVTLGNGETFAIECTNCVSSDWSRKPTGYMKRYNYEKKAEYSTITGVNITGNGVGYTISVNGGMYTIRTPEEISDTEEGALLYASKLAEEAEVAATDRFNRCKENGKRTWAWNVSYHRKCIKEAERQLAYHKAKLSIAALKVKDKE